MPFLAATPAPRPRAALVAIPVAAELQLLAQELLFPALDDA
jgi:hypothetical protein